MDRVYTSKSCTTLCEELGVVQSMGEVGSFADVALAESLNATLKRELLDGAAAFADQVAACRAVFQWADRYNVVRRHSAIGTTAPNAYESACESSCESAYDAARSATLTEAA